MGSFAQLTTRQMTSLAGLGAGLWLAAALLLRALAPLGIYDGAMRGVLYLAIVPGTWPFVVMMRRVAGLSRGQVLPGVAVALMAATLLDGLALWLIPGLYGASVADTAGAGAAILWGAGVFLALGLVADRR